MLNNLIRYFKSVHFVKGFLMAFAMAIPVFISIYFFDNTDIGFSIALGSMLCAPSDIPGSLKHKYSGILISILIAFSITLLIGYFRSNIFIIIPLLIIVVFLVSYISVFGFRASLISLTGLLALVLAFTQQDTPIDMLVHALLIALGGFWYLALIIVSQYVLPKVQVDFLFIQLIEKTSEFINIRGKLLVDVDDRSTLLERNSILQIEINELHETIREVILEKRLQAGFSNRTRRQQLIFSNIMEMYEFAVSNTIDYEKFDELFIEYPEKIDVFKSLIFEVSERLIHVSKVILKEEKLTFKNNFKALLLQIDAHIQNYKVSIGLPESREGVIFLLNYKIYQEKQISNLSNIIRVLDRYSKNDQIRPIKDAEQFITPLDYDFKKLTANFSFKSPIFRHSLRLTLTMFIGFLIGNIFEMQQSYWILLTIVVIMRPSYGLTKQRTLQRVAGTLIGAAIAVGIVLLTQNTIVYAIIAALSLIIGFSIIKNNYRNAAAFITMYVIFMFALMTPNILTVIQFRVFDTLIGSALAYIGNYFFWPAWESKNIKEYFSNSIQSFLDFLTEISTFYHVKGEVSTAYGLARKEAFLQVGNLNAAYHRLMLEPKSKQENSAIIYDLLTIINTYLSSLSSLGMFIRTNDTGQVPEEFNIYIKHIKFNLENANKILNNENVTNNTLEYEELATALKNYENRFQNLAIKRDLEIEKGLPISKEMKQQLHETQLVSEQLRWLYNLSESLVNKLKKI